MQAAEDLADWLVGGVSSTGRRVAVLEDPLALRQLRSSGWVDASTRVFLGTPGSAPAPAGADPTPLLTGFIGTFTRPGRRIELDDGYVLQRLPYADAEFESVELPTELRVWGAVDYSAFLRDFDVALAVGDFPGYLTNPLAILADAEQLAGLPTAEATELRRLFLTEHGEVMVSPTGRPLGGIADGPAAWTHARERWESTALAPGSIGLGGVLDDRDRRDALAERPGLARYLRVLHAHRDARRSGRLLSRVSGFGCRLHADLPVGDRVDPVDSPILAQAGSQFLVIPSAAGAPGPAIQATPEQVAVLECEVALDSPPERQAWALRHLGMRADHYRGLRAALLPPPVTPEVH